MESLRKFDAKGADIIGQYLDRYFYPKFCDTETYIHYRVNSTELQKNGIDYVIDPIINVTRSSSVNRLFLDEKASLDYGDDIPTQCLEISTFYVLNGCKFSTEGWFVNNELYTTDYVFVFPVLKVPEYKLSSVDDISYVRIVVVNKAKIWEKLFEKGFDKNYFLLEVQRLRDIYKDTGETKILLDGAKFQLKLSDNKAECPVNLLVLKDFLYEISGGGYLVSQNDFVVEKKWRNMSHNTQVNLFEL